MEVVQSWRSVSSFQGSTEEVNGLSTYPPMEVQKVDVVGLQLLQGMLD